MDMGSKSKVMKKNKFRRRAIDCTMVEASQSNPNYFKYIVTILEGDGKTYKEPVYGKDMQSALSRLINKEITTKISNKMNTGVVLVLWLAIMCWPSLILQSEDSPLHLLLSFGVVGVSFAALVWWFNYIHRGE
tara:strand:- start:386 stop:784 length:399 start_codon:yes stop_codon:yes gene_type:complete